VLSPPPASPSSPGGSETWGEQFDLPIRHADPRPYCGAKEKTTKATACCALSRAAGLYRTRRQIKATLEYEGALLEAAEGEQCVANRAPTVCFQRRPRGCESALTQACTGGAGRRRNRPVLDRTRMPTRTTPVPTTRATVMGTAPTVAMGTALRCIRHLTTRSGPARSGIEDLTLMRMDIRMDIHVYAYNIKYCYTLRIPPRGAQTACRHRKSLLNPHATPRS
jgi:hypothetical protein